MPGDTETSPHVPQLRALLFTDLVDSTSLVERIGDTASAELFQQHDRLVLAMQQRWRGQQIDRSDGLFLLFERPVDALGFALDYQQALRQLGQTNKVPLSARAGLHVGEVILWNNSAEAIALGSKPVEVEGLAKPMAARLMQLARPGQVLLSATAESMVRRAVDSLGEVGKGLKWKSFGRWRFKGVAQPMEVFGVVSPVIPSVGRPRATPKAMRDIPFWRRPMTMAAEATFAVALVVGGWFITRTEPAIAFAERDWVVVGKLKNLSGNVMLDDSLEQALRISMEQSRYVNVLSEDRAARTMAMTRPVGGAPVELDRAHASAVAVRTGARLVLMPVVATIGGRARFSVDVVDPQSQQTLATATASAEQGSILAAVDDVTRQLRARLGEEGEVIGRASQPLPEVTTPNLDALRAYALGQQRYGRGDYANALGFYEQALRIDGDFALAWLGKARCRFVMMDYRGAAEMLQEAKRRASHLTPRESLYVDNWVLQIDAPDRATDGWARMAELYPDYLPASYNAGLNLFHENRLEAALALSQRVAQGKVELPEVAQDQYGRALLALEKYEAADVALGRAAAKGWNGAIMRQASVAAASRRFDKARTLLETVGKNDYHVGLFATTIALDQGDAQRAVSLAERGMQRSADRPGVDRYIFYVPLAVAYMTAGNQQQALQTAREGATRPLQDLAGEPAVDVIDRIVAAHAAALVALRMGDAAPARGLRARMQRLAGVPDSKVIRQFQAVLEADLLRADGEPQKAVAVLLPHLKDQPRLQLRIALRDAASAAGRQDLVDAQESWLRGRPGFAYAEAQCGFCLQALNVLDVRGLTATPDRPATTGGLAAVADNQRRARGVP